MEDFTFSTYIKIDMDEVSRAKEVPDRNDLPKMVIKRTLTISDVMKYLKEINVELSERSLLYISGLKQKMVLRDVGLFSDAGYTQVYMRDLAPGDTSISYLLSSEDYTPTYIDQLFGR